MFTQTHAHMHTRRFFSLSLSLSIGKPADWKFLYRNYSSLLGFLLSLKNSLALKVLN